MGATLTEQRRVSEEGFRIVKLCCKSRTGVRVESSHCDGSYQKGTANYVPAAAVIRGSRALSGFIGRKASAGGLISLKLKAVAQP